MSRCVVIRETCSCGAEFETDEREAIALVKSWRKTHKHSDKPLEREQRDAVVLSNTDIALGFQAIYNPLEEESE
jgi:hypothetical protein